jgi:hypothetical protein
MNKTDQPGYMKTSDGMLINTNDAEYQSILSVRKAKKQNDHVSQKIHALESELRDIKNLLLQVVNGRNNDSNC